MTRIAVIAGAGPAGLTAALELLRRSTIVPLVFEADSQVGGISKTVKHRGNRMDLGGHRFFSKSEWVMRWWQEILPIDPAAAASGIPLRLGYHQQSHATVPVPSVPSSPDSILLVRRRLSRILYRRRLFDYPLKLNRNTLANMGLWESLRVASSYGHARLRPHREARTLEEFFIQRFGNRLYRTFFKAYTEKVWGVDCREISAEWGAQRIKGLSVTKALAHAAANLFRDPAHDPAQRGIETSLIERFLYPALGPGQMWEEVARRVGSLGGGIHLGHRVVGLELTGTRITAVDVRDQSTAATRRIACDEFISSMPVSELIALLRPDDPSVAQVAAELPYRDFMTVGLLVRRMHPGAGSRRAAAPAVPTGRAPFRAAAQIASTPLGMPPDNWIYIQDPDVRIGRLQIFNNWSPAMVADAGTIWLGLEYFCRQDDDLWSMADDAFIDFAARELEMLGLIDRRDVLDGTLIRVPKAYPAYFGSYARFDEVRSYLEGFSNLYPVGRNGMHRYNNQDHSMLAANCAVTSIIDQGAGKAGLWDINAEDDYHEEIGTADAAVSLPQTVGGISR